MENQNLKNWYRVVSIYTTYNNSDIRYDEQFYKVADDLEKIMVNYESLDEDEDPAMNQIIIEWFKDVGWKGFIHCIANYIPYDATKTDLFKNCPDPKINILVNDYLSDEGREITMMSTHLANNIYDMIKPYLTDKVMIWLADSDFFYEYFQVESMDTFPLWDKMKQN